MKPFAAPLGDILFTLEHVAGASRLPDHDAELLGGIAEHFAGFAEGVIAPLDEPGDMEGCRLENGRVRMPEGFGAAYRALAEAGWQGLTIPEEFGGQGQGALALAATSEIFSGACHSLQMVTGLVPGAARTLSHFATEAQKAALLPRLASGDLLATMCLTEPGAGSDLSTVRTRAEETPAGWRITGEKIFISGGDQDMSAGVLHLVLARTGGEGTKGLSLFLCLSDDDLGRNAIAVTRIEEKMGLHASPTCQLSFDGARAEIIGAPGDGLKAMFTMMNHARVDVALQGVAHAARAHDVAKAYAAERRQGRRPDGAPAVLADHPDVARMLDEQDALALGARAMTHLALVELEAGGNPALVDFLTPVCKLFCTEAGMRSADLGIQILGGYGYLREYRVEQTWRDARITAIYEGANGIHALTLATRMLGRGGAPAAAFEAWIAAMIAEDAALDAGLAAELAAELAAWAALRDRLAADPAEAPTLAHAFGQASAGLMFRAAWTRIAAAADKAQDPARIRRLAARVAAGPAPSAAHLAARAA